MLAPKRMAKAQRRRQLLQAALAIVQDEGTEALTLARLAARAGVTKPIAYEHFGTRAGLLIALFRDYDDRTTEAVRAALKTGGRTLEDVAAILSAAYVDCCLSMGPEVGAVFDALSAGAETKEFLQSWREFLVAEFRKAFAPFVRLAGRKDKSILVGLIGAAETLAAAATAGRASRTEAVAALARIMIGALGPKAGRSRPR
jgi:AcrR family transcriptional regulator